MLHKRFKPAKCKTSLRLGTSRVKLMKNKKGVQITQMKRDLAQLLESGQDRTARIRVEHVIREEKMVAAYDLIEIYCELIIARLPIIESQKTCPLDLKEAITSVIFAAPRCSDIPELLDVRKQFTAKYGKEFISAAIELRPDCGVSRMLVEKLSAVAPDVQTKMNVLSAVAKEHNINWDPTSFEEKESEPPDDLLNGPANFVKASMTNVDPPKTQASNAHTVHSHEEKQNAPVDFSEQNRRYTLGTQNINSSDTSGIESSSSRADIRSSGIPSERMNVSDDNDFLSDRQNWNMEFKDATSAAQAAAESAERASMAARAAAQLSSHGKITRQYSTEAHESNIRDQRPQVSATPEFPGQRHFRDSYNNSFNDRKSKIQNQQMDPSEHDTSPKATETSYGRGHGGNKTSSRPASLRSSDGSIEEEGLINNVHRADGHFRKSSNENQGPSYSEINVEKEFKESKAELGIGGKESFKSEDINYFAEEAIRKQSSISSFRSHSSTIGDELDVSTSSQQKFGKRPGVGNPFAVVDQGNLFRESTNVDAPRDDEADSDDNGPRFDMGFEDDEGEDKSYFQSPGRESSIHPLENTHIWSPRRNTSDTVDQVSSRSHLFSERHSFSEHSVKSVDPSETDNHMPMNFDLSDGPDSESESELTKSSFSGIKEFTYHKQDIFSTNPEPAHVESSQMGDSTKSRIELNDLVERESSFYDPEDEEKGLHSRQSSRVLPKNELKSNNRDTKSYDTLEDNNDFESQSDDLHTETGLNFGTLTGGLRNKGGLRHPPPYTKSAVTDFSLSSKKSVEESSIPVDPISPQSSLNSRARLENEKPIVSMSSSESDSDDYSDKFPVQSSQRTGKQAKIRSLFSHPVAFFNDGSDSDEEIPVPPVPKQTSTSRVHLGSGLSRRTKGPPSAPYSKGHIEPVVAKTVTSSTNEDTNPSRYPYTSESPAEPRSYTGKFKKEDHKQKPESPISKRDDSPPKPRVFKQEASKTMPEPKVAESGKSEPSNTSILSSETSSSANIVKKHSHVHPKLPDYDSLAARLESIRTNRQ